MWMGKKEGKKKKKEEENKKGKTRKNVKTRTGKR